MTSLISVKIESLGRIVTGKTPDTNVSSYFDGEFQFVTPSDLSFKHYFCRKTEKTVTEEAKEKHKNQFIPAGSVMFTCIGNTIGKCAIASEDSLTNQQINSIVPHEIEESKFIYYFLNYYMDVFRGIGLSGGVATPIINKTDFSKVELNAPKKSSWPAIGESLSIYDDLIENNRRRILLLEESARLLYQEWFVHLRFPGHEQVKITDGVPEGWSCNPVDSLLGKVQKKKKVKKEEYLEAGLIPCIDQSQDFIGGYIDDEEAAITENLPIVVFGDHTRIVKFIDFPFAPGADGTQLLIPNDDEMPREYFYFMISSINVANAFYARHFKFLKTTNVLVPEKRLMIDFSTFVGDNMRQIKLLRNQNRSLAQARDLLLPKLMCGELTV